MRIILRPSTTYLARPNEKFPIVFTPLWQDQDGRLCHIVDAGKAALEPKADKPDELHAMLDGKPVDYVVFNDWEHPYTRTRQLLTWHVKDELYEVHTVKWFDKLLPEDP